MGFYAFEPVIAAAFLRRYAAGMKTTSFLTVVGVAFLACLAADLKGQDAPLPKAFIDGNGPGWRALGEQDFTNVNCNPDTWSFKDGMIQCTGTPTGVMRMKEPVTNFELVVQWKHLKPAGNSGVFVWASDESIKALHAGNHTKPLPDGIEVQILDHAFRDNYRAKSKGRPDNWFTTNGDVFATGATKGNFKPFEPISPDGSRSFPRKELSKGAGEWNHYYVRAINGEVRLWVNGEEVSGGKDAKPASGYLCLESEGSPIEFKNLRIRELP
jgi:3-keto-disaccharide hydrolase